MVVVTKILPPGSCAFAAYPFIFVHPGWKDNERTLLHEMAHYLRQRRWVICGLGIGLLAWFALYLLFLPVGWNPFRRRWETEAMLTEGRSAPEISTSLREAPYYLWWS